MIGSARALLLGTQPVARRSQRPIDRMGMRATSPFIALGLWLAIGASTAHAQAPADLSKRIPVQITWDQKIAMRDGVKLSATIYRDPKQTRPLPVIMSLTPYIAAREARQGLYFAQHGYVYAAVDLRGRGNSDGVFVPGRV